MNTPQDYPLRSITAGVIFKHRVQITRTHLWVNQRYPTWSKKSSTFKIQTFSYQQIFAQDVDTRRSVYPTEILHNRYLNSDHLFTSFIVFLLLQAVLNPPAI